MERKFTEARLCLSEKGYIRIMSNRFLLFILLSFIVIHTSLLKVGNGQSHLAATVRRFIHILVQLYAMEKIVG